MKREELKPIELENNLGKDVNGVGHRVPWKAYDVEEVDNLLDAYEARIKELEAEVKKWKQDNRYLSAFIHLLHKGKEANSTAIIDVANRMDNLEAENARLKTQVPKWHSVANGDLPKEEKLNSWFLVKHNNGTLYFADWDNDLKIFTNPRCEYTSKIEKVIEWCEIPLTPPPTEESSATEKENG